MTTTTALTIRATTDQALIASWLNAPRPDIPDVVSRPAATADAYARDVADFRRVVPKRLAEVTLDDLEDYAHDMAARGLSIATQRRRMSAVKSLLSYARRTGFLALDVGAAVRLKRQPSTVHKRIVDEASIIRLLALSDGRARALVALLYYSGARISELCAVTWEDVRIEETRIYITFTATKSGEPRTVEVSRAKCGPALDYFRTHPAPTVVGMSRWTAHRIVKDAARAAGLPPGFSCHWTRHCCATHALERGAPMTNVSEQLGHAAISTTLRFYHHPGQFSLSDYLA